MAHGERVQLMDKQCCINCKYHSDGKCEWHNIMISVEDRFCFSCDEWQPDALEALQEFDEQIRIAEIERF